MGALNGHFATFRRQNNKSIICQKQYLRALLIMEVLTESPN